MIFSINFPRVLSVRWISSVMRLWSSSGILQVSPFVSIFVFPPRFVLWQHKHTANEGRKLWPEAIKFPGQTKHIWQALIRQSTEKIHHLPRNLCLVCCLWRNGGKLFPEYAAKECFQRFTRSFFLFIVCGICFDI